VVGNGFLLCHQEHGSSEGAGAGEGREGGEGAGAGEGGEGGEGGDLQARHSESPPHPARSGWRGGGVPPSACHRDLSLCGSPVPTSQHQ
jgi:hypothetical protein